MRIYVTKYALTTGIQEMDAEFKSQKFPEFARVTGGTYDMVSNELEYFLTKSDAIADANRRRDAKIKIVEKQLAKLRAMTFE